MSIDLDAVSLPSWPKRCACSRTFTPEQWQCLTLKGYVGAFRAGGRWRAVELRDCMCRSTIGIEVDLPMAETTPQVDPMSACRSALRVLSLGQWNQQTVDAARRALEGEDAL